MARRIAGMHELREYAWENNLPLKSNSFYEQPSSLVGSRVQPYTTSDYELGARERERERGGEREIN